MYAKSPLCRLISNDNFIKIMWYVALLLGSHICTYFFNKTLESCFTVALPNITEQPVSQTIKEGDLNIVALNCLAIGMGPIYYQWEKYHLSKNSWVIPSHRSRAVSTTSPNLKFSVITQEDEGVYRCIATNDDGSVISVNASVKVYGECCVA